MPELPEVEHLRRTLLPALAGRRVLAATLTRRDICESWRSGRRDAAKLVRTGGSDLLEGATISRIDRVGKQLAIVAEDDRVLCVHLGMTGRLTLSATAPSKGAHTHAWWTLEPRSDAPGFLVFNDPRRFGGLWTYSSRALLLSHRWHDLGPDALSIDAKRLKAGVGESRRPLKSALLDQGVLAGVGNIYADEALFAARLSPLTPAGGLADSELDRLAAAITGVLRRAIDAGGTTRRDYVDANGKPGNAQQHHAVYGRSGCACVVRGAALKTAIVSQRTTVWCPKCQPKVEIEPSETTPMGWRVS